MADADPKALQLSQQAHRRVIGGLGLLLPFLVWFLAGLLPTEGLPRWRLLDSMSAYYYTGSVGVFVGVLFALSLFLVTYRGYRDAKADHRVGMVAGVGALGVALCPTGAPDGTTAPLWWNGTVGVIHYISAIVLFICLIVFSICLFRKSNVDPQARPPEKRRRDQVCMACGLIMIGGLVWAGSSLVTGAPIFWPEAIAIEAFSISWLAKSAA